MLGDGFLLQVWLHYSEPQNNHKVSVNSEFSLELCFCE